MIQYNISCNLQKGVISAGSYVKNKDEFLLEIDHMQKNYNFSGYKFLNQNAINEEINTNNSIKLTLI